MTRRRRRSSINVRTDENGVVIAADRRTARVKGAWVRWTAAMKRDFLDHLSATCDVTAAAAAIAVDPGSVYRLRRRDERFSSEWAQALTLGYQMLETRLLGYVMAPGRTAGTVHELDGSVVAMDVEHALRMLTIHRNAMQGNKHAPRGRTVFRAVSQEETDAALLASIAKTERKLGIRRGDPDGPSENIDGGEPA